jgi:hypothetical protein
MGLLLDDVSAALVAAGVGQIAQGTGTDWMIYQNSMLDSEPQNPKTVSDNAICIYETPGRPPDTYLTINYPGFQVRVRGADGNYKAVRQKIEDAFTALHDTTNQVSNLGSGYVYCYAVGSAPMTLGLDEKRRSSLVWNFRASQTRT